MYVGDRFATSLQWSMLADAMGFLSKAAIRIILTNNDNNNHDNQNGAIA